MRPDQLRLSLPAAQRGGFHLSGTTSLAGSTLISLARDICYNLIEDGARKIVFMNGHYENYQFIFEGPSWLWRKPHRWHLRCEDTASVLLGFRG
ncbi:MAG: creatininase family protein [Adlercreutzia equolifaciens]